MADMLIHDLRLAGRSPTGLAQKIFDVPETMPTLQVFNWAAAYAASQRNLYDIYIMCHGYERAVDDPVAQASRFMLGYGLQLGDPGLTFDNLRCAAGLKGLVSRITLFACGPAHSRAGYWNATGDGMRFCGRLAMISGAEVTAAVQTQYYYNTPNWSDTLMARSGEIDFGKWEGPVYSFSPDKGTLSLAIAAGDESAAVWGPLRDGIAGRSLRS
jgi:hypothetical protein